MKKQPGLKNFLIQYQAEILLRIKSEDWQKLNSLQDFHSLYQSVKVSQSNIGIPPKEYFEIAEEFKQARVENRMSLSSFAKQKGLKPAQIMNMVSRVSKYYFLQEEDNN